MAEQLDGRTAGEKLEDWMMEDYKYVVEDGDVDSPEIPEHVADPNGEVAQRFMKNWEKLFQSGEPMPSVPQPSNDPEFERMLYEA